MQNTNINIESVDATHPLLMYISNTKLIELQNKQTKQNEFLLFFVNLIHSL